MKYIFLSPRLLNLIKNLLTLKDKKSCITSRVFGVNNCTNTHNRLSHRDSAPADRSEHVNSPDRRELEQGASGGSQAVAESEAINKMALTPPQDPVAQVT